MCVHWQALKFTIPCSAWQWSASSSFCFCGGGGLTFVWYEMCHVWCRLQICCQKRWDRHLCEPQTGVTLAIRRYCTRLHQISCGMGEDKLEGSSTVLVLKRRRDSDHQKHRFPQSFQIRLMPQDSGQHKSTKKTTTYCRPFAKGRMLLMGFPTSSGQMISEISSVSNLKNRQKKMIWFQKSAL